MTGINEKPVMRRALGFLKYIAWNCRCDVSDIAVIAPLAFRNSVEADLDFKKAGIKDIASHYGAARGLNSMKDAPALLNLSWFRLPDEVIIRKAEAIFGFVCDDRKLKLDTVPIWIRKEEKRTDGIKYGKRYVADMPDEPTVFKLAAGKGWTHPDIRVQAVINEYIHAEIEQADGRLRGTRRAGDVFAFHMTGHDVPGMVYSDWKENFNAFDPDTVSGQVWGVVSDGYAADKWIGYERKLDLKLEDFRRGRGAVLANPEEVLERAFFRAKADGLSFSKRVEKVKKRSVNWFETDETGDFMFDLDD